MTLFLILMYLSSICLGYCIAFESWSRLLWEAMREEGMPDSHRAAFNPPWQRRLRWITTFASLAGICFGFWKYGLFTGGAVAFFFVLASWMTEGLLAQRVHNEFHLETVLRNLADEVTHADSAARLMEKVAMELHTMQLVKSAQRVPTYDGSTLYLRIHGAKADNYHRPPEQTETSPASR